MNDPFRFENMTDADRLKALKLAASQPSRDGIPLDTRLLEKTIFSPELFNAYPIETRKAFFGKVDAQPIRVSQNAPASGGTSGGAPSGLLDALQQTRREYETRETTPEAPATSALPVDLQSALSETRKEYETQQTKQAQALLPNVAEVPVMGPSGVVRDVEQPRKSRSIKDYLIGGAEAAATLATGTVAAPVAAGAQLLTDITKKLSGEKPKDQRVYKNVSEAMTFAPRTEAGQEVLGTLGKAFEASKLTPVATPELMALGQARRAPLVSPKAVPGYVAQTGQDIAAAAKAVPGDIKAAAAPALEGIGMRSVGAAGRADQTRFEAAVNMLPEEYRPQARAKGWKNVNPAIIEAHAEALNLPVPFQGNAGLTAGQASGDIVRLSREYNQRGKNPEYAYRFNEQNRILVENLDALRDIAAPDVFDTRPVAIGNTLKNAYQQLDNQLSADIDAKYTALRDAAGGQFPVDVEALYGNSEKALKKNLLFRLAEKDLPEFRELKDLAESGAMDFETYQNLRRNLGTTARTSSDGNVRMAASLLIDELEKLPLSKEAAGLKSLADEARAAARNRFERIKADPAYKAAIDNKVADERFADTFLFGARGTQAQLKQMVQNLGEDQKQVLAAAVIQRIRDKSVNAAGDFSPAAYAKEFKAMEPRLLDIFPGETVQTMRRLGDVAKRVKSSPSGSFFNRSGTLVGALAEQAAGAAEQGINLTVMGKTGIPVPVATLGRERLSARKMRKETEETLEPLAGIKIKLKDIGKD